MHKSLKKALAVLSAASISAVQSLSFAPAQIVSAADSTQFPYVIEGEDLTDATLWTSIYADEMPGYSGEGFFYLSASPASFTVTAPEDGMYTVTVHGAQILNKEGRKQTLKVNGREYTTTADYSREWRDYDFGVIRLSKGENTIELVPLYGYMAVDYITVAEAEFPDLSKADSTPCDPDATPEAKALMSYLHSVYGKNILSGQQQIYGGGNTIQTTIRYDLNSDKCTDQDGVEYTIDKDSYDKDDQGNKFPWHCTGPDGRDYTYSTQNRNYTYNNYEKDVELINELTGKYPAIRFGDLMTLTTDDPSLSQKDIENSIEWADDGGIVGLLAAAHCPRITTLIVSGANLTPEGVRAGLRLLFRVLYFFKKDPKTALMLNEPHITDDILNRITAKTLVLAGSKDIIVPEQTRRIAAAIPGAELRILEGESHGSYIVHNKAIGELILGFAAGLKKEENPAVSE